MLGREQLSALIQGGLLCPVSWGYPVALLRDMLGQSCPETGAELAVWWWLGGDTGKLLPEGGEGFETNLEGQGGVGMKESCRGDSVEEMAWP